MYVCVCVFVWCMHAYVCVLDCQQYNDGMDYMNFVMAWIM